MASESDKKVWTFNQHLNKLEEDIKSHLDWQFERMLNVNVEDDFQDHTFSYIEDRIDDFRKKIYDLIDSSLH